MSLSRTMDRRARRSAPRVVAMITRKLIRDYGEAMARPGVSRSAAIAAARSAWRAGELEIEVDGEAVRVGPRIAR